MFDTVRGVDRVKDISGDPQVNLDFYAGVTTRICPGMGRTVNRDEIESIRKLISD